MEEEVTRTEICLLVLILFLSFGFLTALEVFVYAPPEEPEQVDEVMLEEPVLEIVPARQNGSFVVETKEVCAAEQGTTYEVIIDGKLQSVSESEYEAILDSFYSELGK